MVLAVLFTPGVRPNVQISDEICGALRFSAVVGGRVAVRHQKLGDFFMSSSCEGWSEVQERGPSIEPNARPRFDHKRQQDVLENIIENKIIPRLLLAHRPVIEPSVPAVDLMAAKLAERVDEFAEIVINKDAGASIAFFDAQRKQGASIEQLFQDLLAPTARRLGELWDEDINDFMDVTRGISHLQQIVNEFSTEFKDEGRAPIEGRRALIMPLPGENHTFGASLIGEHFRRDGWRVWGGPPRAIDDIVELVDGQWFDMVGLSASKVPNPERLAADIRAIRRASVNKDIRVMIGGRVFNETPSLVTAVGADLTATDGRKAVVQIAQLIGPRVKLG
jgi:MerR family transcriptional regulator, light-induced transcriptional regulator